MQRYRKIERRYFDSPSTVPFAGDVKMWVVGWKFKTPILNSEIETEKNFLDIISAICPKEIQQISFTRKIKIDNREQHDNYIDPTSRIFYVSKFAFMN